MRFKIIKITHHIGHSAAIINYSSEMIYINYPTGWKKGQKLKKGSSTTFSGAPPHPLKVILILSVAQEQQEEREEESEARHFIDVYLAEMEKNPKDFSFEELCRCF